MNPVLRLLGPALSLWVASVLQVGAAAHMELFGARPDFLLLVALTWPLVLPPIEGCGVGFLSGALHGWVSGVSLTLNAAVRATAGYVGALVGRSGLEIDAKVVGLLVAAGTLVTQTLVFFAAPPSDRLGFVRATIGTALYNGVLAYPVFWGIRRFTGPKDDFL